MVKGIFFYILFFGIALQTSQAQFNTARCLWVKYGVSSFVPDSLTLDPLSLKISDVQPQGSLVSGMVELTYSIDANLVSVTYNQQIVTTPDSLLICFNVFPVNFSDTLYHRSQEDYQKGKYNITYQQLDTTLNELAVEREEILNTPGIRKQGTLTRGIRMGNQQNASFTSALNLQLEGKLSDDLEVEAVLSDQQIPFQPEGNTRQLREIDRVYLALKHQYGKLEAGDISLNNGETHYLKYRKQVLGGALEVSIEDTLARKKSITKSGIALAKGQFVSTSLNVQEGVMGPYKLFGNSNEPFIMIIAGSERVFIDGKLLERGLYHDYVIDYNQAEITFNANVMLTGFTRVRIDYEYVTQNYGRLVTQIGHRQQNGNMEFYADLYKESDLKNNPLTFIPNQNSFNALAEAGDSTNSIIVQQQHTPISEFDADRVLYILKDSVHKGVAYQVYQRANKDTRPYYAPGFIYVGPGKGNYMPGNAGSNGKEYVWVAPLEGKAVGTYTVGNEISAPNLRQMFVLGGKFKTGKNAHVFAEAAFSKHDLNLFSDLHDVDNNGQAIKLGYESKQNPLTFSEKYTWHTSFTLERLTKDFRQIDRFRSVEFNREWGIFSTNADTLQDMIGKYALGINSKDKQHLTYSISYRKRENQFQGLQHKLSNSQRLGRVGISNDLRLLHANKNGNDIYWLVTKSNINYHSKIAIPGYQFESNKHNFELNNLEIQSSRLSNFDAHTFYVKSADTSKFHYNIAYNIRTDEQKINLDSTVMIKANTLTLSASKKAKNGNFRFNLNIREINTRRNNTYVNENTLSGQGTWHQKFLKNALVQDVRFSAGSGRELKRDFVFLTVANGLGTHTWRDNNGNGIQELDEFYEAIMPDERNYAKFFVPGNEFVQVYSSNFYHKVLLSTPQTWRNKNGIKHFFSKWSFSNLFNASYRVNSEGFTERFFPFLSKIPDQNLVSGITSLQSTIYFQRQHHKFGFDVQYKNNTRKQLLSGGYEAGGNTGLALNLRYLATRQLTQEITIGTADTYRNSDFLGNQNYEINSWYIKPSVSFQPGIKWRVSAYYQYKNKRSFESAIISDLAKPELKGDFNEMSVQVKSNAGKNQQVNLAWSSYKINYTGNENSAQGYEMLEGLRNGINHTLRCSLVKKLSNGLQLQMTYSGRKSQDRKLIHTGNMQVSALF